jgi:molecular chaperone Hsp33
MPDTDKHDADAWNRITQLASTVKPAELLELDVESLLTRLFHEETVRIFTAQPVIHDCPEDWDKVGSMLRSLGRNEVDSVLQEHGEIVIKDDICNREYRFDAQAIDELFRDAPASQSVDNSPTLH